MPNDDQPSDWNTWGMFVLKELQRLNTNLEADRVEVRKFQLWTNREISALQVKAGIWGLLGGFAGFIIPFMMERLSK